MPHRPAPFPANEAQRLEALDSYGILDTEAEKPFDDLVRLAAQLCGVPIGVVSLVDGDRQWFKAVQGLPVRETPRDLAFCAHAILAPDTFVVEDAQRDDRFDENPLVLGEPYIRFYAGAPLVVEEGFPLGTLCLIDRRPRRLSERQLGALGILRGSVVTLLELGKARTALDARDELMVVCA